MLTEQQIRERFIPFDGLRYTTEAFIDYRIPGCSPKKNYALIGPGVSQNPNQPVSLREKHGFQVGGVSMPAGTTNPPHMHFTAEVFMCTKGRWQFHWGFNPESQQTEFGEGDICTVPTWIYRGFQSQGPEDAFMFTALGRDDTGGILWGPDTLQAAREQGVHLTEDYRIIDEQSGDTWSADYRRLQPMTRQEIAALRVWSPEQMARRIVRFAELDWSADALLDSALPGCGAQMAPVIGLGMTQDRDHAAPVTNSHGFSIEWLRIPAGGQVSRHRLREKQVLLAYRGTMSVDVEAASGTVRTAMTGSESGWDSFAMPADVWRSYRNTGSTDALFILATPGDGRKVVEWDDVVQAAAADVGRSIDADGFAGPKCFIDRSQR